MTKHVLASDIRESLIKTAIEGKLSNSIESDTKINDYLNELKIANTKDCDDFNIPNTWKIVELGDLVSKEIKRGKSPKYDNNGKSFAFAQKCNSKYDGIRLDLALRISDSSLTKYKPEDKVKDLDIIINSTGGGTIGRIGLFRKEFNVNNNDYYPDSHVTIVRAKDKVNPLYLLICLKYYHKFLESAGEGSTNQTELKPKVVKELRIPLPPIEEQQRIVDKVDELMAKIDEYEKMENQLVELKEDFPTNMKDSILQAAMQGKMTKGLNSDTYIKISKTKELEEEIMPFAVPDNWSWYCLQDLADNIGGYAFKSSEYVANGTRVIRISDFDNYGILNKDIVRYKDCDSLKQYEIKENDILMCMTGGTVGKNCIVKNIEEKMLLNQRVACIRNKKLNVDYLYYVIKSPFIKKLVDDSKNSTNDNISMALINSFPIPVPSTEEQQRIVDLLDKLLPLCDDLKEA